MLPAGIILPIRIQSDCFSKAQQIRKPVDQGQSRAENEARPAITQVKSEHGHKSPTNNRSSTNVLVPWLGPVINQAMRMLPPFGTPLRKRKAKAISQSGSNLCVPGDARAKIESE